MYTHFRRIASVRHCSFKIGSFDEPITVNILYRAVTPCVYKWIHIFIIFWHQKYHSRCWELSKCVDSAGLGACNPAFTINNVWSTFLPLNDTRNSAKPASSRRYWCWHRLLCLPATAQGIWSVSKLLILKCHLLICLNCGYNVTEKRTELGCVLETKNV